MASIAREKIGVPMQAVDGLRGLGSICIAIFHFFSGYTPNTNLAR